MSSVGARSSSCSVSRAGSGDGQWRCALTGYVTFRGSCCRVGTINAAIGRRGPNPGCDNGAPGEPYAQIMEQMTAAGALPILAHVNAKPAGLLTTLSGQPLVPGLEVPAC